MQLSLGDSAARTAVRQGNACAETWDRVKRRLRAEFGEDIYSSWFARIELDERDGDHARLSVPTRFLKSWIQSHYADRISQLYASEDADVQHVQFVVRGAARTMPRQAPSGETIGSAEPVAPALPAERPSALAAVDATGAAGSPLDRRLVLETFMVGRSNALAHAAALQLARARPGEPVRFNPLYVHASVGLGKTHLLQAIAAAAPSSGRRALYLTAERFMFGFVSALKAQTAIAFKEALRAIDVLVIDDVQFLQGKTVSQEFGHTLNALIDGGKQVVIAADRPPSELESLDERLRSRLAGGLVVEMGPIDEELRVEILKGKVAALREQHPGFDVPEAVVAYIAGSVTANGRELDGAVNRLLAHNTLTGTPITLEMAEVALKDLIRNREPKRVKIEDIQRVVARHYNVSRADLLSSRRTANVVRPRQIAMYLAKTLTLRSLPEIGRRFGGRDHTTVLHAVRKIEELAGKDPALADELDLLKRLLQE